MGAYDPYLPLNVPKPFGEDVWIVDGPEISMDYGPIKLPFPTRMTVVRLADGTLWVHSPIAPDDKLFTAIEALGEVRHLVAPNSIHYWYMADWIARYPQAATYALPDHAKKAKRSFHIDHLLVKGAEFDWQNQIDWLVVPGTAVTEAVFFAHSAKTLILTDLIENFESPRVHSWWLRMALRLFGADGSAPYDLRSTFFPRLAEVRPQIGRVLAWPVERIVIAHGKSYETGAREALEQGLRWAAPKR